MFLTILIKQTMFIFVSLLFYAVINAESALAEELTKTSILTL